MTHQQTQRKIIQINHALSGVHGPQIRQKAIRISDVRKEILRRLERKKKHSAILHDQLYQYLEKFPEEKSNLQKEVLKTKKNNFMEVEEKQVFQVPVIQYANQEESYIKQERKELNRLCDLLKSGKDFDIDKIIENS